MNLITKILKSLKQKMVCAVFVVLILYFKHMDHTHIINMLRYIKPPHRTLSSLVSTVYNTNQFHYRETLRYNRTI